MSGQVLSIRRKSLESWIEDALSDPDKVDANGNRRECIAMALMHVSGESYKEIHNVKFIAGKDYTANKLYQVFKGRADAYSQDLPGVQMFQLVALYAGGTEPEAYQPFQVMGKVHQELGSEAPDDRGERQQRMRWNDGLLAQIFRRQEQLDMASMRMIEAQNRHIETMGQRFTAVFTEHVEALEILKNLMVEKESKQQEYAMQQLQYDRETKQREAYLKMLPAVANTLFGREIFPVGTQDTAILELAAKSLNEEQAMQLASILPPEVSGILFSRFSAIIDQKRKESQIKQLQESHAEQAKKNTDGLS